MLARTAWSAARLHLIAPMTFPSGRNGSHFVNFPDANRVPLHLRVEVIMKLPFVAPVQVRLIRQTWLLYRVPSARLPQLANREIAWSQGSLPQFASSK